MRTIHQSFCRNCTHSCGLLVTVKNGLAVDVKPDRAHPVTDGYFCIKAKSSLELHGGDDGRVVECLKRGDEGQFDAVSAANAIDEIGDRLKEIVDRYDPRAVAVYMGTGGYFNSLTHPLAKAWLQEVGSPNFFTSSTVDQSARWVAMMRMGFVRSGKPYPADVDVLMLVGANPLISHWLPAYNPYKRLREWSKRGAKTIVVDPRHSETARIADMHLPLKPGEDATLFAGMVRLILENGWQDKAFCDRYIGDLGTLRQAVQPFTPDYVEARAGISADLLMSATRTFSCSGKSLVVTGTGIAMTARSNLAVHMAEVLNALCGGFRRAGDKVTNPGILLPRSYADAVVPPSRPWEQGIQCHSAPTGQIYGEMPTGALAGEILTPGEHKIRALIVLGGNPLKALGQPEKTLRAFRDLDLLVSLDARMSDTARLSHYVIPPALPFERHDLNYVLDGIGWSSTPFLQYAAPIATPPPGVIDETLFFWGIARRMGLSLEYRKVGLSVSYKDAPKGLPLDMDSPPDPEALVKWWVNDSVVDFETLRAAPGGLVPALPPQTVDAAPDTGERMDMCPPDVAAELAEVYAERTDAAWPYRLATRRIRETMNSAYRHTRAARKSHPVNPAFMNPADLSEEQLLDGDRIEVASRHGSLVATVKSDRSVRRGMISMAQCFGETDIALDPEQRQGSFTGRLVSLDEDIESINRMPAQTGISVAIRKVE